LTYSCQLCCDIIKTKDGILAKDKSKKLIMGRKQGIKVDWQVPVDFIPSSERILK